MDIDVGSNPDLGAQHRWPGVLPAVLWFAVGLAAVGRNLTDDDQWQSAYAIYTLLLVVATATTLASVALATGSDGGRFRKVAVGLSAVAGLSALVAWAQPIWAVFVAVGVASLALSGTRCRRDALLVAAGSPLGLFVSIAGILLRLGSRNQWGDYPDAEMVGIAVGCVATATALVSLGRRSRRVAIAS